MDKRYQVFISSTYTDLREARAAVSEALLRANCFPAGMELFPAADAEQFDYIKEMIDQSDYYLILLAGRYGSISPESGLSYTEMEYDYAVETGKPVIRLLHRDPMTLTGDRLEQTDEGRKGLEVFRTKLLDGRLVSMWDEPKDLKAETILALQDIQRRHKSYGWVRGDAALDAGEALEVARLRARLADLEERERKIKAEREEKHPFEDDLNEELSMEAPTTKSALKHPKIAECGLTFPGLIAWLVTERDADNEIWQQKLYDFFHGFELSTAVADALVRVLKADGLVGPWRSVANSRKYLPITFDTSYLQNWADALNAKGEFLRSLD